MCDQKQLPGFSVWAASHHLSSTQGVQLLSDLQKQDHKTEVEAIPDGA